MALPDPKGIVNLHRLFETNAASSITEGTDHLLALMSSQSPSGRKFQRLTLATLQAAIAALVPGATDLAAQSNQYASTAAVTIANSAVEATLIGAGKGTLTQALASLAVGSTFELEVHGVLGTHSSAGSPTIKIKIGSKTLATVALTLGNSLSAVPWMLRAIVTVTTAGGSGVVNIGGEVVVYPTSTSVVVGGFSAAVSSTDLSAAAAWDITGTWSAANAANTITSRTVTINRQR